MKEPVIVWFRQDLRLADNPALRAAAATGQPVIALYVLDDDRAGGHAMGAASRWWLHCSLYELNRSLNDGLHVRAGNAKAALIELVERHNVAGVYWNRCYEPWRVRRDKKIKATLRTKGITATSFDGCVLFPPQSVSKSDGSTYRVFTPYYKNGCLANMPPPRQPFPVPEFNCLNPDENSIDSLALLPSVRWYDDIAECWTPGEQGAKDHLQRFVGNSLHNYKEGRNRPDQNFVSRLSPHLHYGEVSPNQAWYAASDSGAPSDNIDCFQSELGWREFSQYLLYHFPELPDQNFQPKFDRFTWLDDKTALQRWQRGQTGYPIVDAGMRELWRTGYMHNRVRMVVGSFLVKNLLIHWRHGADWFWDTLVDADLANNSASWQWVAGSGADAAPYFRIFNPVTQGQKFDPEGTYVRQYVPELSQLPDKFVHCPWEAPNDVLSAANVVLGDHYPFPIVDLKRSRQRALDAFKLLRD